jgi:uncharacterized membrane protein YphA (DoxX/SURF4 family)
LAAFTWLLRALIGVAFIFFASMKLSSQPRMVAEFTHVGLGQWFRYFTGSLELIGGISVLIPRVSALGAALLLIVVGGAFVAQLVVLHGDVIHAIVIALLLATLIYLQRSTLLAVRLGKA